MNTDIAWIIYLVFIASLIVGINFISKPYRKND